MSRDGVRHEVARVFIRDDPVFCHRDRTGTCVGGNPGVRSSRDNVASALLSRQPNREGTLRLPASRGGRELGLEGMANSAELPLSRRDGQQAKGAERLEPKRHVARRGCRHNTPRRCSAAGGEAEPNPSRSGTRAERGKPHRFHNGGGRPPVRVDRWTRGYGMPEEAKAGR